MALTRINWELVRNIEPEFFEKFAPPKFVEKFSAKDIIFVKK